MKNDEFAVIRKIIRSRIVSILLIWVTMVLLYINLTTDRLGEKIVNNLDSIKSVQMCLTIGVFLSLLYSYNFLLDFLVFKKRKDAPIEDFIGINYWKIVRKNLPKYFEDKYVSLFKIIQRYLVPYVIIMTGLMIIIIRLIINS